MTSLSKKKSSPVKPKPETASTMKVVTVCIHKGGTGKTTSAIHLVHFLEQMGKRVLLVDTDTQGNATQAFLDEQDDGLGASLLFHKSGKVVPRPTDLKRVFIIPADSDLIDVERLPVGAEVHFRTNLRKAAAAVSADYVVIDTPPSMGFAMLAPLVASDYAFSPIVPDPYGIKGVKSLFKRVTQIRDLYNKDLNFLGLLINRFNSRNSDQKGAVKSLTDDLADYMIPFQIGERASIARVAFSRQPVWALKSGAAHVATKEMRGALGWIVKQMEAN